MDDVALINQEIDGFEFTDEGANALFERVEPVQESSISEANLGRFQSVNYFDIVQNADDSLVLRATANNPHNRDTIKQLLPELSRLNPNKRVNIEFQDGGKIEKILTEGFIQGIDNPNFKQANVEVEAGEFINADGEPVKEVLGKKHSEGGEEMQLEEGTEILSDHLKIGGTNAKDIRKMLDIKVKAGDTYSDVARKYRDKSGMTALLNEKEEIIKQIGDQNEVEDESTAGLNLQFLSKKLNELETEQQPLEVEQKQVFAELFALQEASKPKEERAETEEEASFQLGGTTFNSDQIVKLGSQFDLSPEDSVRLFQEFKKGGKLMSYQDAGEVEGEDDEKIISRDNPFNIAEDFVNQSKREGFFFGKADLDRFEELTQQFPLIVEDVFDIQRDSDNNIISANIKEGKSIKDFQQAVDNNFQSLINDARFINNPELRQQFIDQVSAERFDESQVARGFDDKFGNFTSSRVNFGFQAITPEDLKKVREQGITTVKQLFDESGNIREDLDLSQESKDNLDRFENFESDFLLGDFNPFQTPEEEELETVADENVIVERDALDFVLLPDQSPLPPDALQPHLKNQRRFDRIDPNLVSPEQQIEEINRNKNQVIKELNKLPDNQRRAALASLNANTTNAINSAIQQTNRTNAQLKTQADQINLQQDNAEENFLATDALDFERRQLTALAKTQNDIRNYFNQLNRIQVGNFNTINDLNLINDLNDDFQFTSRGVQKTTPNPVFTDEPARRKMLERSGVLPITETKKKGGTYKKKRRPRKKK